MRARQDEDNDVRERELFIGTQFSNLYTMTKLQLVR